MQAVRQGQDGRCTARIRSFCQPPPATSIAPGAARRYYERCPAKTSSLLPNSSAVDRIGKRTKKAATYRQRPFVL